MHRVGGGGCSYRHNTTNNSRFACEVGERSISSRSSLGRRAATVSPLSREMESSSSPDRVGEGSAGRDYFVPPLRADY